MTSVLMLGSVVEVGLVIVAAVIFLTMVVAALAVIVWSVAGFLSATHQTPTTHR